MLSSVSTAAHVIFGGDTPIEPLSLAQIAARTVIVYLWGLFVVRIGRHRLISRISAPDVLFAFVLGSLLSRGITGHASLSGTAVSALILVLVHDVIVRLSFWSHAFGKAVKDSPILLAQNGEIDWDAMRRCLITEHDLAEALRLNGKVNDVSEARSVYQERSGEISVVPKK